MYEQNVYQVRIFQITSLIVLLCASGLILLSSLYFLLVVEFPAKSKTILTAGWTVVWFLGLQISTMCLIITQVLFKLDILPENFDGAVFGVCLGCAEICYLVYTFQRGTEVLRLYSSEATFKVFHWILYCSPVICLLPSLVWLLPVNFGVQSLLYLGTESLSGLLVLSMDGFFIYSFSRPMRDSELASGGNGNINSSGTSNYTIIARYGLGASACGIAALLIFVTQFIASVQTPRSLILDVLQHGGFLVQNAFLTIGIPLALLLMRVKLLKAKMVSSQRLQSYLNSVSKTTAGNH